jgi:hypothetical protein
MVEISEQDIRRIAVEADCDVRTVRRLLGGKDVRVLVRARIRSAYRLVTGRDMLAFEDQLAAELALKQQEKTE